MIARLRGLLVHKDTGGIIVECGGVGYGVAMSLASLGRLPAEGAEVLVWVHTHVSQDALRLYGFADTAEREAFMVLVATAGVGPKLALAILSTMSPVELADAVAGNDKGMLTRIPGVGAKKAERLLVELRDRLPRVAVTTMPGRAALLADLVSALENLGFATQTAGRVARQALDESPGEEEVATLVRAALRLTTKAS